MFTEDERKHLRGFLRSRGWVPKDEPTRSNAMITFEGSLEELKQLAAALIPYKAPPDGEADFMSRAKAQEVAILIQATRSGEKIRMIKAVRAITGLGLKESKDLVEANQ